MTLAVHTLGSDPGATAEWDDFARTTPGGTLYHRLAWRRIFAGEFGWETHYLGARDASGLAGILPLVRLKSRLFGDFLVSLPCVNYGGVVARNEAADRLLVSAAVELAGSLRVSHLELRELQPRDSAWPVRTDKVSMQGGLAANPEEHWGQLPAKLRSQVRRPQKEGATARIGGAELLPQFYAVFARNMRDLGTPVYGRSFFAAIARELGEHMDVVIADLHGQPVAAGILLHSGGRTEIPWASSLRSANRLGVNMLMYWESLKRAISRGSTVFDFGRSTQDSGTYRFKRQWGAEPVPLYWHYWLADGGALPRLNPSNPKYALAIAAWQRLPLWLANGLGPHIVRNLP
ncbi:MAG: FemAB family PEP-CTERM system-associated protein [Chromatiales bacterium]|nr:FemAB family PEP-CTERM system-associated protein [Chromatiales bacterium]